jgi:hypothetical protein
MLSMKLESSYTKMWKIHFSNADCLITLSKSEWHDFLNTPTDNYVFQWNVFTFYLRNFQLGTFKVLFYLQTRMHFQET